MASQPKARGPNLVRQFILRGPLRSVKRRNPRFLDSPNRAEGFYRLYVVALVEVEASLHTHDLLTLQPPEHQLTSMTWYCTEHTQYTAVTGRSNMSADTEVLVLIFVPVVVGNRGIFS